MGIFDGLLRGKKEKMRDKRSKSIKGKKVCAKCGCAVLDVEDSRFLSLASEGKFIPLPALTNTPRLICENCGAIVCTGCFVDVLSCPKCGSEMRVIPVI